MSLLLPRALDDSPVGILANLAPREPYVGNYTACSVCGSKERIVAIGDVHGNYEVMLQVLHKAGVISSDNECSWNPTITSNNPVQLIQVGDIVDRGPAAPQAWRCLRDLQENSPTGSSVIRLIGNHEIYWLEGNLRYRNKQADTQERTLPFIEEMKHEICSGTVHAAYSLQLPKFQLNLSNNIDNVDNIAQILVVHAGLRPAMLQYLLDTKQQQQPSSSSSSSTENIKYNMNNVPADVVATWINQEVKNDVCQCVDELSHNPQPYGHLAKCKFKGNLYSAGSDRGGIGLGGVFWTDYRYLAEIANITATTTTAAVKSTKPSMHKLNEVNYDDNSNNIQFIPSFSQIVGHTAQPGSIRSSVGMSVICIDGGMQWGGRTYLEIDSFTGRFIANQQIITTDMGSIVIGGEWDHIDLTDRQCKNSI